MAIEHDILDDNLGNMIAKQLPSFIKTEQHTIEGITPLALDLLPNYENNECTLLTLYRVTLSDNNNKNSGAIIRYFRMERIVEFKLTSMGGEYQTKSSSDLQILDSDAISDFNEATNIRISIIRDSEDS